jgi:hypothetical protein
MVFGVGAGDTNEHCYQQQSLHVIKIGVGVAAGTTRNNYGRRVSGSSIMKVIGQISD